MYQYKAKVTRVEDGEKAMVSAGELLSWLVD